MGPGEEARQPSSPKLPPFSLCDGAWGGRVSVFPRFSAFQKLSEKGVNVGWNETSQRQ